MSSTAIGFPAVGARESVATVDEKLLRAARELLRGGPVCFKLSTRVKAELLPRWKRRAYVYLCREAPERLRVPPRPAMQITVFTSWSGALSECETPDHQLLVMPLNRSYSPNVLDVTVECRPRDAKDAKRFELLRSVFGDYAGGDESGLREQVEELAPDAKRLIEKCRRV